MSKKELRHPARRRSSAWAAHVRVQAEAIDGQLAAAMANPRISQGPEARLALDKAVTEHLQAVRAVLVHPGRGLARTADWWRGTAVEQAFCSLHYARIFLVDLLCDDDVHNLVPDAVARVGSCLDPTDPRRRAVELLPAEKDPTRRRAGLRHALEMGYAAADESHARLRAFRNVLLCAALLTTAFMVLFIWFVSVDPRAVPLCFHPTVSATDAQQAAQRFGGIAADYPDRMVCPTGEQALGAPQQSPNSRDVQIVAGLGVLGGALASTASIRKHSGKTTPFGIPVALAFLKLPTGALTAVAGIILLGGAFVPGLSDLDSQRQILAYALVFGFAQQLVTQFIDRRASTLIAQLPSRQSDSPTTSMPPASTPADEPLQAVNG